MRDSLPDYEHTPVKRQLPRDDPSARTLPALLGQTTNVRPVRVRVCVSVHRFLASFRLPGEGRETLSPPSTGRVVIFGKGARSRASHSHALFPQLIIKRIG